MKTCSTCHVEKPEEGFYRVKKTNKLVARCKECCAAALRPRSVCPGCKGPAWGKKGICLKCLSVETVRERFLKKVNKDGPQLIETKCWIWTGTKTHEGYGQLWYKGKAERATKVALLLYKEPLPPGLVTCHKCDNPPCVNPEHLFTGTLRDNSQDRIAKGRIRHCGGKPWPR